MYSIKKKHAHMRFKKLRLFLDDLISIAKFWYFRFADFTPVPPEDYQSWPVISEFSTCICWRPELKGINRNRVENMRLGCSMITGVLLNPGEIFSMRRVVGEPTTQRGFKTGPMLVGGELGFAPGGGLCQVATTLFNTALAANLKILQKYNHTWDIWGSNRDIDLGRDAVYSYVRHDLKFKNSLDTQIAIAMAVDEASLRMVCRIYAPQKPGVAIRIQTDVLEESRPLPLEEEKYCSGWRIRTRRYVNAGALKDRVTYDKIEQYKPFVKKAAR